MRANTETLLPGGARLPLRMIAGGAAMASLRDFNPLKSFKSLRREVFGGFRRERSV